MLTAILFPLYLLLGAILWHKGVIYMLDGEGKELSGWRYWYGTAIQILFWLPIYIFGKSDDNDIHPA